VPLTVPLPTRWKENTSCPNKSSATIAWILVALIEIVLGTLARAWLYKEKEQEAPAVLRPAA
jgi:hypothetical protein